MRVHSAHLFHHSHLLLGTRLAVPLHHTLLRALVTALAYQVAATVLALHVTHLALQATAPRR